MQESAPLWQMIDPYDLYRVCESASVTSRISYLELVQKNLVPLRRSDEDRRRASIKTVHGVSDEVFRGANRAPLKMTPYCAV